MFEFLSYESLCLLWFIILGVLLAGYAVLDGFDLGVGILHLLLPRTDEDRRISLNSIGPLWDGNEVWLVTFGGALFAMFPAVYASVFSGFYLAFMLLLLSLIFRAVSIEFRSKVTSPFWRSCWDFGFAGGSFLASFLFGVAVGNIVLGLPLNEYGDVTEGLLSQLSFYPLMCGVFVVTLFAMHGSIFLYLKTEGDLQLRTERWVWRCYGFFLISFMLLTMLSLATVPRVLQHFRSEPWLWVVPVLNVLAVANIPRAMYKRQPRYAFVSSVCTIVAHALLLGAAIFPELVPATNPAFSLTAYNSASSHMTLSIGLLMVLLGMPCVLAYTASIYWAFRGKVKLDPHSY